MGEQPNIDYNVKTVDGSTLGHAAVMGGNVKCVETLANQEFDCWNVPDRTGVNPIMIAIKKNMTEILDLLWTYRNVQQEVILRQADSVSSLQSLSRDAVLLILS